MTARIFLVKIAAQVKPGDWVLGAHHQIVAEPIYVAEVQSFSANTVTLLIDPEQRIVLSAEDLVMVARG